MEEFTGDEPNKAMRKMLAARWKLLPEDKQITIRASRAKRGVKCDICGKIGFYREMCPNKCVSPPGTPDSWASTPPGTPPKSPVGLGVLWGERAEEQASTSAARYDYRKKVDTNTVRPQAQKEEKRLQQQDAKIGTFEFFAQSEEGYADSYSQMTLHQVMRRLMRLLERQLNKNTEELEATFDTTLLHPPFQKEHDKFYPAELQNIKEYRDYFIKKETKLDHKKIYKNQSSVRTSDELDQLFRGGNTSDDFLYKVNPKAGASMHSKNTWKSILSHSDELASSDPTMAKKEKKLQDLFHNQSKWIALQKKGMEQKNDRFEHLVNILKDEIKHEHDREGRGLQASKHATKATQMKLYQERLETVDKIMSCLQSYNFTSGLDEADFLIFCFDRWKETLESKLYGRNLHHPKRFVTVPSANGEGDGTLTDLSKPSPLKRSNTSATNVTTATSQTANTANNPLNKATVPGMDYNRMIAAANPYAQDLAFLEYMDKKHHRMRLKAMAGSGIGPDAGSNASVASSSVKSMDSLQSRNSFWEAPSVAHSSYGAPLEDTRSKPAPPHMMARQVSFADDQSVPSAAALQLANRTSSNHSAISLSAIATDNGSSESFSSFPHNHQQLQLDRPRTDPDDAVSLLPSLSGGSSVYEATGNASNNQLALRRSTSGTRRNTKNFTVQRRMHPREIDEIKMEAAKGAFKRAGLKGHIRKGVDEDLAYLAPTLIPVPGAFRADGSNPMISHTAENILFKVKKNMILGDIGYTPQSMVPLYARNTLIEKNGTSAGGDQNYDVMATDRRYSHYVGRPLNRFEPAEHGLKMADSFGPINEEILRDSLSNPSQQLKSMQSILAKNLKLDDKPRGPSKRELRELAEKEKAEQLKRTHRAERRLIHEEMEKAKGLPLTKSLVRLAFKDPMPSLKELSYLDD